MWYDDNLDAGLEDAESLNGQAAYYAEQQRQDLSDLSDPIPVRTGALYRCSWPECSVTSADAPFFRFFRITRTSDGYARIACNVHKDAVTAAQADVHVQEVI